MEYFFHIIIILNVYIIIGSSTNLLVGYINLISLGQAGFYGIGAYITALCLIKFHLSLFPCLLAVMVINGLVSLLISYSAIRLRGDFFTLATIGFQLIVFSILYNWVGVTKGPYGVSGIPAPVLIGQIKIANPLSFLILSCLLTGITLFLINNFISSPFGRLMKALRDDEISLSSLGRNPAAVKTVTMFLSASLIGLASFIYTTYITYIDPKSFDLDESLFILSSVLIGGSGNMRGPIVGAVFVVLLPEFLRFLGLPTETAAALKQIIYGLLIIIIMRFKPQGLAGSFKFES